MRKVAMTIPSILAQKQRFGDEKLVVAFMISLRSSFVSLSDIPEDVIKAWI
jgi:hypothetical protein